MMKQTSQKPLLKPSKLISDTSKENLTLRRKKIKMSKVIYNSFYGYLPKIGPQSYNYYFDSNDIRDLKMFQKELRLTHVGKGNRGGWKFEGKYKVLYSYYTPVLAIDSNGNAFRLWDGWSRTTSDHVKAFYKAIPKKEWLAMKVYRLGDIL